MQFADYSYDTVGLTADLIDPSTNTGVASGDDLAGIENIRSGSGNDYLRGDGNSNILEGMSGNDWLYGRAGDDTLVGGDGDDVLTGGAGADVLNGSSGEDRAQYSDAIVGLIADLIDPSQNTGIATGDTYISIENLYGGAGNDWLRGDNFANVIDGQDGDDIFNGRGGDDDLRGGAGDDVFVGGAGADILEGGSGSDTARYATAVTIDLKVSSYNIGSEAVGDTYFSIENLFGSEGDDDLRGDSEENILEGNGGDDILLGRGDNDLLIGGEGKDTLIGGGGADSLFGGLGTDRADYSDASERVVVDLQLVHLNKGIATGDTFESIEIITGSAANDGLRGDAGGNILEGAGGDDFLNGREGDDDLRGGSGDDILTGGAGNDILRGGTGSDAFRFYSTTEDADLITNFGINNDTFQFDSAGFTSLSAGALSADNFVAGTVALDADDFVIYDGSTVFYDADGNGTGAAIKIATIGNNAALDEEDFLII